VPQLSHLEVVGLLQRRGIGTALIRAAEDAARQLGHEQLTLAVGIDNPTLGGSSCGSTATKTRLWRFRGGPHRPTLTALLQAAGVVSLSGKVAAQMKGRASSGPALVASGSPAYGFRDR